MMQEPPLDPPDPNFTKSSLGWPLALFLVRAAEKMFGSPEELIARAPLKSAARRALAHALHFLTQLIRRLLLIDAAYAERPNVSIQMAPYRERAPSAAARTTTNAPHWPQSFKISPPLPNYDRSAPTHAKPTNFKLRTNRTIARKLAALRAIALDPSKMLNRMVRGIYRARILVRRLVQWPDPRIKDDRKIDEAQGQAYRAYLHILNGFNSS